MSDNIIKFGLGTDALHAKAVKYMDKGNHIEALDCLRKCLKAEPDNTQYALDLAMLYSEMEMYEQSVFIITQYLSDNTDSPKEALYCMAVNMAALDNFDDAYDLLQKYIDEAGEDGALYDEALNLLETLEYYTSSEETRTIMIPQLTFDGNQEMEKGNLKAAIKKYEESIAALPDQVSTLLPLAFAYYSVNEQEKALSTFESIMKLQPDDLTSICNYLVFCRKIGKDTELYKQKLEYIKDLRTDDFESLVKITMVLCDLDEDESVLKNIKKLLMYKPYDVMFLHIKAVAHYNLKQFQYAIDQWSSIDLLEGGSIVARYCIGIANDIIKGKKNYFRIMYSYHLPYSEVLRYFSRFDSEEFSSDKMDDFDYLFIKWVLSKGTTDEKMMLMVKLGSLKDERYVELLRELMLNNDELLEIKLFAAGILNVIDSKKTNYVCIDGKVSQYNRKYNIPAVYFQALDICIKKMAGRYTDYRRPIIKLFNDVINNSDISDLRAKLPGAFAAALEYSYAKIMDLKLLKKEVMEIYGVGLDSLNRQIEVILNALNKAGS